MDVPLTDIELLQLIKNHNQAAFESLYRLYWKRLYDFVYVKTHDGNVAEEIVQDLFVTLWEKRDSLLIHNIQSYLFASARNRIIDYYRQKTFDELDNVEVEDVNDYPIFLEELQQALQEAVEKLPPKTKEVFRLNRFEGQSTRQIANRLQLTERAVEYHITQALRTLKTLLKEFLISVIYYCLYSTF
ncbi:RNA polymerase sigma-70 factor [Runella zeae]|uniref:RNA polymerase sigma-70 factor n=1 Tax=Runella zeae TaxID=94255 RepID=UPI000426AEB4|nr:RNA polymerase sigma-70 factor [Runella zeae]